MARDVLVTGATGTLGWKVVGAATAAGHHVRAMIRRSHVGYTGVHWSQGDLLAGTGVDAAVDGMDVIMHCATQATGDKDVTSTQNLITAAKRAGVAHIIYISISTYRSSASTGFRCRTTGRSCASSGRSTRRASGVGHTVLRATQLHDLIKTSFAIQRGAVPAHPYPRGRQAACRTHRLRICRASRLHRWPRRPYTRRAGTHGPRRPGRASARRRSAGAGAHRRRLPNGCEPGAGQCGRHHRLCRIPRGGQIKFAHLSASP
jgi:hypothetical protein